MYLSYKFSFCSGWGVVEEARKSDWLQKAVINEIPIPNCIDGFSSLMKAFARYLPEKILESQMCATGTTADGKRIDTCQVCAIIDVFLTFMKLTMAFIHKWFFLSGRFWWPNSVQRTPWWFEKWKTRRISHCWCNVFWECLWIQHTWSLH